MVYDETAQYKHKNSLTTLDYLINRSVMASFISYTKLKLTNDTNKKADKLGFLTRAVAPNP